MTYRKSTCLPHRWLFLQIFILTSLVWSNILSNSAWAQVALNEVLADNAGVVSNGSDFPDYIELLNRSTTPVNLAGASLTDDPANPRRFVFPEGTSIAGGAYLVVWCDDRTASPGLHTGFGLGAQGERVRLYAADGITILDEISFGLQLPNLAVGRFTDGTGPWVLNTPTPGASNRAEATGGPTGLRINEWMARPSSGHDWIELFNVSNMPVDLGGTILTDSTGTPIENRPIPDLSFIAPRGYRQFFASDLDQEDADHLDFRLGSNGETLTLFDADQSTVLDRVTFGAQSEDISQGRAPDGSDNFVFFQLGAATPGEANVAEISSVVISEILSHTDPPLEDAIELQNLSNQPVDVGHWWLSDSASEPQRYRLPAGTIIPPMGFIVIYEYQFSSGPTGFSLDSAEGDEVYLSAGDASGQLLGQQTFVEFGALRNPVPAGRFQTSVGIDFVPLERPTFGVDNPSSLEQFRTGRGAVNAGPRIGPVVISEIYPGQAGDAGAGSQSFLELHNPTTSSVPLYDVNFPTNTWRLRNGISFNFPFQITIPAGEYALVVGFNPAQDAAALEAFRTRYSIPATVPVFGPFDGRLAASGETIDLRRPDEPEGLDDPNAGFVPYEVVESISYALSAPWPQVDVASQSLQRRELMSYGNEPLNWTAAAPTPGRPPGGGGTQDSDRDGMPDEWERSYGLSPESDDAGLDRDNDGLLNRDEFLAGTSPRDDKSTFRIDSLEKGSGQLRLRFSGIQGKSYNLQSKEAATSGRWLTVTNLNLAAANGTIEVVLPNPAGGTALYRLVIPSVP